MRLTEMYQRAEESKGSTIHDSPNINLGHTTETDASKLAKAVDALRKIECITANDTRGFVQRINKLAFDGYGAAK